MTATIWEPDDINSYTSVWEPGLNYGSSVDIELLASNDGPIAGSDPIYASIYTESVDSFEGSVTWTLTSDNLYDGEYGVYLVGSPGTTSSTPDLFSGDMPVSLAFAVSTGGSVSLPVTATFTLSSPSTGLSLGTPSSTTLTWNTP